MCYGKELLRTPTLSIRPEQTRRVSTDPVINGTRHGELWMDISEQDVKPVREKECEFLDDQVTLFILGDMNTISPLRSIVEVSFFQRFLHPRQIAPNI